MSQWDFWPRKRQAHYGTLVKYDMRYFGTNEFRVVVRGKGTMAGNANSWRSAQPAPPFIDIRMLEPSPDDAALAGTLGDRSSATNSTQGDVFVFRKLLSGR